MLFYLVYGLKSVHLLVNILDCAILNILYINVNIQNSQIGNFPHFFHIKVSFYPFQDRHLTMNQISNTHVFVASKWGTLFLDKGPALGHGVKTAKSTDFSISELQAGGGEISNITLSSQMKLNRMQKKSNENQYFCEHFVQK